MPGSFTRQAFNRQLLRTLLIPLLLLLVCPVVAFLVVRHLADVVRWDRHSLEVLGAGYELEKSFIDLETGVRGYRITGDLAFLEPYDAASTQVGAQFDALQGLVVDSADQTHRLELIRRDYEGWQGFANVVMERVRTNLTTDLALHQSGKALMDRTRADTKAFLQAERRLLEERSATIAPARQTAVIRILMALFLTIAGVLWWTWTQMKQLATTYEGALQAMDLERERLRVTLASIGDAVIVTDRDGVVTFLNSEAERMTGWAQAEAAGQPLRTVFRIINEETRHPVDDPVEKVFREHRVIGLANHTVLISKSGVEWLIEDSASPIFDADRAISGVVLVFQDAGERRRAQKTLVTARDQAIAASRAKDDFLAALSHELRTPLNPVLLLASENATRAELDESVRDDFRTIMKNVMLEARLIDDLLDLTRITNRKLSLDLERVDVRAVLQDAMEKVTVDATEKGLRLESHLEPGPAWARGDSTRLEQVFWNVLRNAVKFTTAGGHISTRLAISPDGKNVTVSVTDTGMGLTAIELKQAFEPFAQGQHAEKGAHRFGGLGLGLAIARNIMELHAGTIQATSPGRNQGATFTITLTLTDLPVPTEKETPVVPARRGEAIALPPYRILLVEDHDATRRALAELLSKRGCRVVAVESIAAALAAAAADSFDLVISDLGLPDGDGVDLMRILQQKYGLEGIATSGFGTEADIAKTRRAGFHAHLTKPIMVSRLETALASGPWARPKRGPGPPQAP